MSIESAKEFLKKLAKDEVFRKSLENASSDEERKKIVKDTGFYFTKDDLEELAAQVSGELSDGELEQVAGGSNPLLWIDPLKQMMMPGAITGLF